MLAVDLRALSSWLVPRGGGLSGARYTGSAGAYAPLSPELLLLTVAYSPAVWLLFPVYYVRSPVRCVRLPLLEGVSLLSVQVSDAPVAPEESSVLRNCGR